MRFWPGVVSGIWGGSTVSGSAPPRAPNGSTGSRSISDVPAPPAGPETGYWLLYSFQGVFQSPKPSQMNMGPYPVFLISTTSPGPKVS